MGSCSFEGCVGGLGVRGGGSGVIPMCHRVYVSSSKCHVQNIPRPKFRDPSRKCPSFKLSQSQVSLIRNIPDLRRPSSKISHIPSVPHSSLHPSVPHPKYPSSRVSFIQYIPHLRCPSSKIYHISDVPRPKYPTTQVSLSRNPPCLKCPSSKIFQS